VWVLKKQVLEEATTVSSGGNRSIVCEDLGVSGAEQKKPTVGRTRVRSPFTPFWCKSGRRSQAEHGWRGLA